LDASVWTVVTGLATGPTGHSVAGWSPTEDGGFLWVIKFPGAHFLRRGSKAVGPMSSIYGMLKNPTQHEWDALSVKFPDPFLTRDILFRYQMALAVESGWFEKVLWQQVSHLLLKYTRSGYGTVLTAACACQGCSATEWVSVWTHAGCFQLSVCRSDASAGQSSTWIYARYCSPYLPLSLLSLLITFNHICWMCTMIHF
jgi:hypothetical protein